MSAQFMKDKNFSNVKIVTVVLVKSKSLFSTSPTIIRMDNLSIQGKIYVQMKMSTVKAEIENWKNSKIMIN